MKYQNRYPDNKIRCTLCPRNCILKEGARGFCHIRQNINNEIVLSAYGHINGFGLDPVEKKPLYHFYPGSLTLSLGTLGCNMGCLFCQNYSTTKSKEDPKALNKYTPEMVVEAAIKNNCKSIAFTYNDPVIFIEYAIDVAELAHKAGLKTIAISAGYINEEGRKDLFKHMDAVNIDLKAFSEDFYSKNCGAHLEPVLETIKYIKHHTKAWLELTTLLIEGENDSPEMINEECEWIIKNLGDTTPLHFSAFYPCYKFSNRPATSIETLYMAYGIAQRAGLKYVYSGNVNSPSTQATYCKKCTNPIILRQNNQIEAYALNQGGHCVFCKTLCDGNFE